MSQWNLLTDLSLTAFLAPADLFSIITKSRALQTLTVGMVINYAGDFNTSALTPTTLLDLVSLQLAIQVSHTGPLPFDNEELAHEQNRQTAGVSDITSRIICPGLKILHFSWLTVLAPISQALETLGLDISLKPEALTECLSLVPNLISFDFVDVGMHQDLGTSILQDAHLAALTPSADNPSPLCPQLLRLRMIDHTIEPGTLHSWSTHVLVEFITARAKAGILDYCDLFFLANSFSLSDEEARRLHAVKEDGKIELRLHHAPSRQTQLVDEPTAGIMHRNQSGRLRRRLFNILDDTTAFDTRVYGFHQLDFGPDGGNGDGGGEEDDTLGGSETDFSVSLGLSSVAVPHFGHDTILSIPPDPDPDPLAAFSFAFCFRIFFLSMLTPLSSSSCAIAASAILLSSPSLSLAISLSALLAFSCSITHPAKDSEDGKSLESYTVPKPHLEFSRVALTEADSGHDQGYGKFGSMMVGGGGAGAGAAASASAAEEVVDSELIVVLVKERERNRRYSVNRRWRLAV
ncbi:hypothetical protein D9757_007473 [Collybiopsis confluens]|uniref:Uncharacterized protein n=1 Tax=Collybiopsis confluens TaxID=2823264 RepID=A0A8H5M8J7_9AGAR|nr:hypothetical protein D9757_007473 [Collybiopsis confluens]